MSETPADDPQPEALPTENGPTENRPTAESAEAHPEETETVTPAEVRVRRSPRYFRFMITGAVLFAIVALILTFSFPENPTYDRGSVFDAAAPGIERGAQHGGAFLAGFEGEPNALAGQTEGSARARGSRQWLGRAGRRPRRRVHPDAPQVHRSAPAAREEEVTVVR